MLCGMIYRCTNPASWHPTLHTINRHHNPPTSWTKLSGGASQIIQLCGVCHDETHTLLNEYVRAGSVPTWEIRRTYSIYVRQLAQKAWDERPNDKPPYTTVT